MTGGRPYLAGKPLFREGRDARANQDTVTRYKAAAVTPQGAVLTCVFRGRNSEGSNFPDDQCRGIVLVGVPYANYGDPLVRAQIAYYDRRSMGLGNRWYTMDAFRAANQALGRGIRSREDWCHYWLLDQRYAQHQRPHKPLGEGRRTHHRGTRDPINAASHHNPKYYAHPGRGTIKDQQRRDRRDLEEAHTRPQRDRGREASHALSPGYYRGLRDGDAALRS